MKYTLIDSNIKTDSADFIAQYLARHGVAEKPEEFFDLTWSDVQSPENLDFIHEGVDLLIKHIEADSKIAILVDVDMDGFTSSALLYNYLTFFMEPDMPWESFSGEIVPMFHGGKLHGLDDFQVMRDLRDTIKPNLLIIPDASGSQEQYDALTNLGIDILVLDHHDMSCRGDGEKVVVINNQQSERYTNKELSGVGVTWQFCCAVDQVLGWDCAGNWLDLVACGMIGDMMNLRSRETRFLIFTGLQNINNYFLRFYQFNAYSMQNKEYNPHNIAFYIVPMFNAVCRIGTFDEKLMLWKALTNMYGENQVENGTRGHKGEMVPLVQEAIRLASNAKGRQDRRKNKLAEQVHQIVRDEGLINHKVLVFGFDDFEEEYRALSGLAANVLAEYYQRPVILTFKKGSDYVGSLRVPDTDNPLYKNFKDQCKESGFCTFVAGHQEAAGIGVDGDSIEALMEYFDEKYEGMNTEIMYNVDFIIDANDENLPSLIENLYAIRNIHGQGLKEPKIAVTNVKISPSNLRLVGQKATTLWITTPYCKFINFKSSKEEYDSLKYPSAATNEVEVGYNATIICDSPDMNTWAGVTTPQLQIIDYEIGRPVYAF